MNMYESNAVQLKYVLFSFLAGVISLLIYDFLRVKRRKIKTPNFIINIEDGFFLLFLCGTILWFGYHINGGIIRLHGVLALFLGIFIYRIIFGNKIFGFLNKFTDILFRILFLPVRAILRPVKIIYFRTGKNRKKIKNIWEINKTQFKIRLRFLGKLIKKNIHIYWQIKCVKI